MCSEEKGTYSADNFLWNFFSSSWRSAERCSTARKLRPKSSSRLIPLVRWTNRLDFRLVIKSQPWGNFLGTGVVYHKQTPGTARLLYRTDPDRKLKNVNSAPYRPNCECTCAQVWTRYSRSGHCQLMQNPGTHPLATKLARLLPQWDDFKGGHAH